MKHRWTMTDDGFARLMGDEESFAEVSQGK